MTATTRTTRRAWLVFAAAAAAYLVAIVHRTALGVAGVEALDRFHIGATGLAALSIAQIATYAALQPPAGRMLDKWGPRTMMVAGSLLMAAGQALMAVNHDYKVALIARLLIGAVRAVQLSARAGGPIRGGLPGSRLLTPAFC